MAPSPKSAVAADERAGAEPAWQSLSTVETARRLTTHLDRGLGRDEAARRLKEYGPNALASALEPSAPGAMGRPPLDPHEPLMNRRFAGLIAWQGGLLTAVTLFAFWVGMRWYGAAGEGARHAVTIAFMTLALAQVFHAFNARSQRRSALDARLFTNRWLWGAVTSCVVLQLAAVYWPFLGRVLHTVPLNAADWGLVGPCALAPVVVDDRASPVVRRREQDVGPHRRRRRRSLQHERERLPGADLRGA